MGVFGRRHAGQWQEHDEKRHLAICRHLPQTGGCGHPVLSSLASRVADRSAPGMATGPCGPVLARSESPIGPSPKVFFEGVDNRPARAGIGRLARISHRVPRRHDGANSQLNRSPT